MPTFLWISHILLWIALIGIGFLLLGTLRSLGLVQWRLDQLEATRPSRINRSGIQPGGTAPDFTLPRVGGGESALSDYTGRRVLLVFVQAGCQPCHEIAPELNRLQRSGELQVLVINRAEAAEAAAWADDVRVEYPVLVQDGLEVSKRYEVFATPFAFVIDEQGRIASSGIVSRRRYLGFVLDAAEKQSADRSSATDGGTAGNGEQLRELEVAEI